MTGPFKSEVPFLRQARAMTVLRRELAVLETALAAHVGGHNDRDKRDTTAPIASKREYLHASRGRLVVQLGAVGISFSWMQHGNAPVADGRLLVMEWDGIVACSRGVGDTRTAVVRSEQTFQVDGTDAAGWRWRNEDGVGESYTTSDLAAMWMDRTSRPAAA